jgi:phosphate transport system substrate-binding protein
MKKVSQRITIALIVIMITTLLLACGDNNGAKVMPVSALPTLAPTFTPVPQPIAARPAPNAFGATNVTAELIGGGSTRLEFMNNLWLPKFKTGAPNVKLSYQMTTSGNGQSAFLGTPVPQGSYTFVPTAPLDFAASDFSFTTKQLVDTSGKGQLVHIPMLVGAVVVTYRLDGYSGEIRLSAQTLAKIFLGEIKQWNHPDIQNENPGALPNKAIKVVIRDRNFGGSGTNELFSRFLAAANDEVRAKVGVGSQLNFPQFGQLEGRNGAAVAALVKQNDGAIGYVDQEQASIRNSAGRYVPPTPESLTEAADGIAIPDDFRTFILEPQGPNAYPIAGFSWLVVWKELNNMPNPTPDRAQALVNFLWWSLHEGQKRENFPPNFAPLPPTLVQRLEGLFVGEANRVFTFKGQPILKS